MKSYLEAGKSGNRFTRALSRVGPKRRDPEIPPDMRLYAVGDIHGCLHLLERLLELIRRDSEGTENTCRIVFLGDYIDRGPDSKGVIDRLLSPLPKFEVTYLLGNHDQTLLDFLENPSLFREWRYFGAQETFMSYGVEPPRFDDESAFAEARDNLHGAMPPAHIGFLKGLELSANIGDYFFVHAGVRPGIPLDRQEPQDLLWIRDEFLDSRDNFGSVIVHGHTPSEHPTRKPNRIGIDTGAYATGQLTTAVLEQNTCRFMHT